MAPHFHWFLPANGDGRDIVGGGHGVAAGSAGAIRHAGLASTGPHGMNAAFMRLGRLCCRGTCVAGLSLML